MNEDFFSLILLAGGKGHRFGAKVPKQFLIFNGKALARHSFDLFVTIKEIREIIIVCPTAYRSYFPTSPNIKFATPGKERQDSLENGFHQLSSKTNFILTHDAARPLIRKAEVLALMQEGIKTGAATLGTKVTSTIKSTCPEGTVTKTLERSSLWNIQTPQLLKYSLLKEGLQLLKTKPHTLTDDVSIAELLNHPVQIIEGRDDNLKVTTPADLTLLKMYHDTQS